MVDAHSVVRSGWLRERGVAAHTGSRKGNSPLYMQRAHSFGVRLGHEGFQALYYGDGDAGTMGALANGAIAGGACVQGITLPFFAAAQGSRISGAQPSIVVDTMHVRMDKMRNLAGAVTVSPGSYGTMEEGFEWHCSDYEGDILKPQIIVNYDGYWNGMVDWLNTTIERGYSPKSLRQNFYVASGEDQAIDILNDFDENPVLRDLSYRDFLAAKQDKSAITRSKHALLVEPASIKEIYHLFSKIVSYDLSNIPGQTVFSDPDGIIRPAVFVNDGGYYDGLQMQLDQIFKAGFTPKERQEFFYFASSLKEAKEIVAMLDNKRPIYPASLTLKHAEARPDP